MTLTDHIYIYSAEGCLDVLSLLVSQGVATVDATQGGIPYDGPSGTILAV